ncbi:MAG: sulfatase-like hydrolase/transferase [Candidatus Lokiarchaeota archaeon]|nr:sulfatase-like hydrolase/transferase [Candidatus Lokiarchaeota archaeon]
MSEENPKPNIIIFIPDEMRGDCISLSGRRNPIIHTPNFDDLAKDGVAFTNCFTVNPVCGPSRCCTFTGQYVHSNGHRSLYQLLQPHEDNLFKFLKNNGYEVVWLGRNDLFNRDAIDQSITKRIRPKIGAWKTNPYPLNHPMRKSFYFGQRTLEESNDPDYHIIQKAIKYLNSEHKNPFCLYIALNFPHPPYTVEEPYFSMYDRETIPEPIPSKFDDKPKFMKLMHERYGLDNLKNEDFKEIVATYYGMITRVDHLFGQLIDELKQIGEYDNSAIFMSADHGDYAGDYGLTEKWPNAFQDCLVNVPLIIKTPKSQIKNKIIEELVQTIDIFPTVLNIAKIITPYTHFGIDLLPLINNEIETVREVVFAEGGYNPREPQCFEPVISNSNTPGIGIYYDKTNIPNEDNSTVARSVMIRTKYWKLIIRDKGKEELYDLIIDPKETNNLIDSKEQNGIKLKLKEKLLRWYLRTSDNANWKRERNV